MVGMRHRKTVSIALCDKGEEGFQVKEKKYLSMLNFMQKIFWFSHLSSQMRFRASVRIFSPWLPDPAIMLHSTLRRSLLLVFGASRGLVRG